MPNSTNEGIELGKHGVRGRRGYVEGISRFLLLTLCSFRFCLLQLPGLAILGKENKYNVPLQTVVVGPGPRLYTPEQIVELRGRERRAGRGCTRDPWMIDQEWGSGCVGGDRNARSRKRYMKPNLYRADFFLSFRRVL